MRSRQFPAKEHTYLLKQDQWNKFCTIFNIQQDKSGDKQNQSPFNINNEKKVSESVSTSSNSSQTTDKNSIQEIVASTLPQDILSSRKKRKIVVIGAGSMGYKLIVTTNSIDRSLFAGCLALNDANKLSPYTVNNVWLLTDYKAHAAELNKNGLILEDFTSKVYSIMKIYKFLE